MKITEVSLWPPHTWAHTGEHKQKEFNVSLVKKSVPRQLEVLGMFVHRKPLQISPCHNPNYRSHE